MGEKIELKVVVKSLDHLKRICEDGEPHDFYIQLSCGRSSKIISHVGGTEWCVFNMIDDSEDYLSDEELYTESNIGRAIESGNFYCDDDMYALIADLDLPENLTHEQLRALAMLVQRYEKKPEHIQKEICGPALMCNFGFIWIGIEPDGYAHS